MAAENVLATQATIGFICSGVLQWLKKAKWIPFVNDHSAAFNHAFLIFTSLAGATGIHAAWNASTHSLTITDLSLTAIVGSLWLWAKQYTVQHIVHKSVFGSVATPTAAPKP